MNGSNQGRQARRAHRKLVAPMSAGLVTLWTAVALAQDAGAAAGVNTSRVVAGVVDSLVYTVLGILLLVISYKVFGAVVPFDLNKELAEDDNTAVGVFMAGIFIAIGLVISAAIGG